MGGFKNVLRDRTYLFIFLTPQAVIGDPCLQNKTQGTPRPPKKTGSTQGLSWEGFPMTDEVGRSQNNGEDCHVADWKQALKK